MGYVERLQIVVIGLAIEIQSNEKCQFATLLHHCCHILQWIGSIPLTFFL